MFIKNQQGFIQIPILLAIVAGVLTIGGTGYLIKHQGSKGAQISEAVENIVSRESVEPTKALDPEMGSRIQNVKTSTPSPKTTGQSAEDLAKRVADLEQAISSHTSQPTQTPQIVFVTPLPIPTPIIARYIDISLDYAGGKTEYDFESVWENTGCGAGCTGYKIIPTNSYGRIPLSIKSEGKFKIEPGDGIYIRIDRNGENLKDVNIRYSCRPGGGASTYNSISNSDGSNKFFIRCTTYVDLEISDKARYKNQPSGTIGITIERVQFTNTIGEKIFLNPNSPTTTFALNIKQGPHEPQ